MCRCYGMVRYGYNWTADWTEERLVQGSIQCQDEVFGDTNSENEKHCWCSPISGQ